MMVPGIGIVGVLGPELTILFADRPEMHPAALVTVNE